MTPLEHVLPWSQKKGLNALCTAVLLLVIQSINCSTFYISPSKDGWCPDADSCLTISEVASNISKETDSNVSLIISAGNHSLTTNLTVQGLDNFSMSSGSDLLTVIECGDSAHFQYASINHIHIQGITLKECFETKLTSVTEFILANLIHTQKHDEKTSIERALTVINSTGTITSNYFQEYVVSRSIEGAIIYSMKSTLMISNSTFTNNSAQHGGVIYCIESFVLISNCTFANNTAARFGGVAYIVDSTVLISNSQFTRNSARTSGVLHIAQSTNKPYTSNHSSHVESWIQSQWANVSKFSSKLLYKGGFMIACIASNFTVNKAGIGGVMSKHNMSGKLTLYIDECNFAFNVATYGAVVVIHKSHVTIHNSTFQNSETRIIGGAGVFFTSKVSITNSVFCHNYAGKYSGGLYFTTSTTASVYSSIFHNNTAKLIGGSMFIYKGSKVQLIGLTNFTYNTAPYSAVINVYESDLICNGSIIISNNNGSISMTHSQAHFSGNVTLFDNKGSLYFFDTDISVSGLLKSIKQNRLIKDKDDYSLEGGSLTFFVSRFIISGTVLLNENIATNGGGILSITSRIVLNVAGQLNVTNNTATDTGGGLYLYHSELYVRGLILVGGNRAEIYGGGIHCISSTIVIIIGVIRPVVRGSHIKLANNSASSGGGICLEANSKFYIKHLRQATLNKAVDFIKNIAKFGGAIYVADNTTSGTCFSNNFQSVTAALQSQCFVQIVMPITIKTKGHIGDVFNFINNTAKTPSAKLYGGLLDRCTVNAYGRATRYSSIPNSFDLILNDTTSDPVRVCLCNPNSATVNCSRTPNTQYYRKGSNFTLTVAAVDQVNRILPATIHGSLKSQRGHLGDGQQAQQINDTCTILTYSIFSPLKYRDYLYLYAEGPCKYYGISSLEIKIRFIPCTCPIGFETVPEIKDRCTCTCHSKLKNIFSFIRNSDCNYQTMTLQRNRDFWITATNLTSTTYVSYKHCPSAYCRPSLPPVHIDFSTPNEADVQCAFNHTGVLCGKCKANLTLSLGSSRCIECPQLWPLVTLSISVCFIITGLAMVAVILLLNLTVATGTLNAMIFYANVLATDQQHLLAFEHPNFHSVVVSWLNLDIGFDACFFKGLNAYSKAWLQLAFPVYIILIVVTVIVVSQHSRKFATLIARKNPVATLATLILFSYAKLLHNIIGILSFAKLLYTPIDDNKSFTKLVWLYDGSIAYLQGKHIPLFILAVLIMIIGLVFTFLLLCWQNLVKLSNKWAFFWVRNTKLSSFIDAYHAPYNARNRYWTGLLLLARIILYFTAGVNISGEPSVNLLTISLVIGCILLIHVYSGMAIYRKWTLNIFEFTTYINILTFVAIKFYIELAGGSPSIPAYISISIQVVVLICSIIHHVILEFHLVDKIKYSKWYKNHFNKDLQTRLLPDDQGCQQNIDSSRDQNVTFTEVAINKTNTPLPVNTDSDREREDIASLLDTEDTRI